MTTPDVATPTFAQLVWGRILIKGSLFHRVSTCLTRNQNKIRRGNHLPRKTMKSSIPRLKGSKTLHGLVPGTKVQLVEPVWQPRLAIRPLQDLVPPPRSTVEELLKLRHQPLIIQAKMTLILT